MIIYSYKYLLSLIHNSAHFPGSYSLSTKLLVLVLNKELIARGGLVLVADEIGDSLVLRLLGGALVVLGALTEDIFLDVVDGCESLVSTTSLI